MASDSTKIKNSVNIEPKSSPTLNQQGDVGFSSSVDSLQVRQSAATDTVALLATAQTLTNKTIDADSNTITNIENADIKAGADIARNKLASGTASHVLINDGSGVMSSEAALAITRGGTGQATQTAAFDALAPTTTKGDLIAHNGTDNIRVPVGMVDGQVLSVDSGESSGLAWVTPSTAGTISNISTYTDTSDIADDDDLSLINIASAKTLTLPDASLVEGRIFRLKKIDSTFSVATIDTDAGDIDGVASTTLNTLGEELAVASDGNDYHILYRNIPSVWTTYSLTIGGSVSAPTKGTTATDLAVWRRIGDSIQVRYFFRQTAAGADGSGVYLFPLPAGLTFDTTKAPEGESTRRLMVVGSAQCRTDEGADFTFVGNACLWNTTNVFLTGNYNAEAGGNGITDNIGNSLKLGSGDAIEYGFEYIAPISGWNG